jgi:hypothetical protein
VNYIKGLRKNASVGILMLITLIPLTGFGYFVDSKNPLKVPLYFYASFYFSLAAGATTIYTANIHFRLSTTAEILESKLKEKSLVKAQKANPIKDEDTFNTLSEIYGSLMDSCDEVNLCFGLTMMMSFGLVFFYTLFIVFTAYTDVVNGCLAPVTISSATFCIYYNFFLTGVIYTFTKVENKV